MSPKEQFSNDELVKILIQNGQKPENITILFGFIGDGKNEETITLYMDALLQSAIELKKEDIIHTIKLTKTQAPLGGTYVWIKNASEYLYGVPYQANQQQAQANQYFQGNIYNQFAQQKTQADHSCTCHCQGQQPHGAFTQYCQPTQAPICNPEPEKPNIK